MGVGVLPHVTRAPTECFFHPDLRFLSTCVSRLLWKITSYLCFWSGKLISNFNVFNNIKITFHYSICMRTSGEKVRISDEAERVQSVSYSHIRSLPGWYTVVCLREGKRGTGLAPPFTTVMCKVAYLAFKGAPNSSCNMKIPSFQRGPK